MSWRRLGFTGAQQPELRVFLGLAWARQPGAVEAPAPKCLRGKRCKGCEFCAWYEAVLEGATGKTSTTECNAGRDYEDFMAALEEIHGEGVKWCLKAGGAGDAGRILHELDALAGGESGWTEQDLRAIARQMRQGEELPELGSLSERELITVRRAAKQQVTRELVAAGKRAPQVSRRRKADGAPGKRWGQAKPAQVRAAAEAAGQAQTESTVEEPF